MLIASMIRSDSIRIRSYSSIRRLHMCFDCEIALFRDIRLSNYIILYISASQMNDALLKE